ncbi:aminotransferase class V-fold PLP-dependent enzyme [Aliikangiella maris]|uniref:Cysteine desulfurase n=2 Tax=Aliikangiella maris TaxID=3162458 RepID=A0ABV2BQ84_9GAMM
MTMSWHQDFPAIKHAQGSYLDSASSCQVPNRVIKAINDYLTQGHGNPHRGMYAFSENANHIMQQCRANVAQFINASEKQIIFTSGTTESINQVTSHLSDKIKPNHSILVTQMEHHANLLPWQRLASNTGAKLNVLPFKSDFTFDLALLEKHLSDRCAIFACTQASNVLGNFLDLTPMMKLAKSYGVTTLIDGAQAIAHYPVDVVAIDCDFYAFSGHKLYAPSGIGVLYCRTPSAFTPHHLGGGIVKRVTHSNYLLNDDISQFEAGTPNMPAIVGLNAALKYFNLLDKHAVWEHENQLIQLALHQLKSLNVKIHSSLNSRHLISFTSKAFHSHDIATVLADNQISVRAGHHCAQPCLAAMKLKHCVRVSVAMYNTEQDIMNLLTCLKKLPAILN